MHSDAVQAVGALPVSFAASGLDAMTVTGHKFGGPYGTGALLLKRGIAMTPLTHGGGQEREVRSGTLDVPGVAGFAAACRIAVDEQPARAARVAALRDELVAGVRQRVPDVVLNGAPLDGTAAERRLPGNAHLSFPGCEGDSLLMLLDAKGVECSTGSACSAGIARPSHVLLAMQADAEHARSSLRFSLGHTSTRSDVTELLDVIGPCAERSRRAGALSGALTGAQVGRPDRSHARTCRDERRGRFRRGRRPRPRRRARRRRRAPGALAPARQLPAKEPAAAARSTTRGTPAAPPMCSKSLSTYGIWPSASTTTSSPTSPSPTPAARPRTRACAATSASSSPPCCSGRSPSTSTPSSPAITPG